MLTVDYDRLGVGPGDVVLDLGCGFDGSSRPPGRGAPVVALDAGADEAAQVRTLGAMIGNGGDRPGLSGDGGPQGRASLPFADADSTG